MTDPETRVSAREKLSHANFAVPVDRLRRASAAGENFDAAPRRHEPLPTPRRAADYQSIKGQLHDQLLDELNEADIAGATEDQLAQRVQDFVARVLIEQDLPLNETEQRKLTDELWQETLGVGPLAPLMGDPAVTDILVNRYDMVYVERFGKLERTSIRFRDPQHLVRIIQRIAARVGRRIDESQPMVDARLPDGSRVNATLPPVTLDSATLSIRRFGKRRLRRDDLQRLGMFSPEMRQFIEVMVQHRINMVVSGGTGAGKSTFLGAVAESIPDYERIITIEDAAELILDQEHVIRKETRPANLEGQGRISARDLVANSLRMRPDRIIVGEVRGAEALDMLQAMNTGHDGSLTTVHANSPRDALARLETMVLMAGLDLPSRAIREQIAAAIDVVVYVRRYEDGVRRVERISELTGIEELTIQLQDIFVFERTGLRGRSVEGRFTATGIVPRAVQELRERGVDVPLEIFRKSGANRA
ncbi:MAG: CpaF family protein [Planctomycetaceae bacterium]|nr:CpaF family protein [Planctomycetaceae bacterium]